LQSFAAGVADDARVLRGRFVERHEPAFRYQGFGEALVDAFRESEPPSGDRWVALAPPLRALFPMLGELPAMQVLLDRAADAPLAAGSEDSDIELISRAFGTLARDRPLVLLFEGLHEAAASINALHYLLRRLATSPILLVGTYRGGEVASGHPVLELRHQLRSEGRFDHIELSPLSPTEHDRLIEALLGSSPSETLLRSIYEATAGNPYFALEYTRSMRTTGNGRADDESSIADVSAVSARVPASLRRALDTRLDRLEGTDREVLAVAGLLGRHFEFQELERLAGDRADAACDRLIDAGVLVEDVETRGETLRFASSLLHRVATDRLSHRRRRTLSRKIAARLRERLAALPATVDGPEPRAEADALRQRLFDLLRRGGDHGEAIEVGLELANEAFSTMRLEDAARLLTSVLVLIEADTGRRDRGAEGRARLLRARVHHAWGDRPTAAIEAARAADLADEAAPEVALDGLQLAAELAWDAQDIEHAESYTADGLRLARRLGRFDAQRELLRLAERVALFRGDAARAESHRRAAETLRRSESAGRLAEDSGPTEALGDSLLVQGEYRAARQAFEQARAERHERAASSPRDEATYLLKLGQLALKLGRYDEVLDRVAAGLALIENLEPALAAELESLAGLTCCSAGRFDDARDWVDRGVARLAHPELANHPRLRASLLRTRGNLLMETGRPGDAVTVYRDSLEAWQRADNAWERSIALFNIAEALAGTGDYDAAEATLAEAERAKAAIGDRWGLAYVHLVRGRILLDRADPDAARLEVDRGSALADELGDPKLGALLRVLAGRIHLAEEDVGSAEAALHRALADATAARADAVVVQARTGLAAVALARGRFAVARDAATDAVDTARRCGTDGELGAALLVLGDVDVALGLYEEAGQPLREALDLERAIGNPFREVAVLRSLAHLELARGRSAQALPFLETLLRRAEASADPRHRGLALVGLAEARFLAGEREAALKAATDALGDFRAIDDRRLEASVHELLSRLHRHAAEFEQAETSAQAAIEIYGRLGESALRELGRAHLELGKTYHEEARSTLENEAFQSALYLMSQAGDRAGLADCYRAVALTRTRREPAQAVRMIGKAIELAEQVGYPLGQALATGDLGEVERRRARLPAALAAFDHERELLERIRFRGGLAINAFRHRDLRPAR
ncbi:MAG: tetratricopeptide repeat protein, partial [Acidobacteriota bacterium]